MRLQIQRWACFLLLPLVGCDFGDGTISEGSSQPESNATDVAVSSVSAIRATPDPCVITSGSRTCTSRITWHVSSGMSALVRVSGNGGPEQTFACGHDGAGNGSSVAPWIGIGSAEFRLYNAPCNATPPASNALAAVTVSGRPPLPPPHPALGINKFDLAAQYFGYVPGSDFSPAYQRVAKALGRKSIIDARNIGVTYLRVAILGFGGVLWGSSDRAIDLWQSDPATYWAYMDQMMADLNAHGVKLVVSFLWNFRQFPAKTNETVAQMITNRSSRSYLLVTRYIGEFVNRYKDNPAIYLYELGNELNLGADLDLVTRCHNEHGAGSPWCQTMGNYTTTKMIGFTSHLAAYIRSLDPHHRIDTGFATPRGNAEHMRVRPEWYPGGPDWTPDTRAQLQANLADVNQGADVISIHFYNADNERFGITGHTNAGLLDIVKAATDQIGKPLFIGEFADLDPYNYNDTTHEEDLTAQFTHNVLQRVASLRIPYSAPWIWEYYWHQPVQNYGSFDPSYTPINIGYFKQTNEGLGNPVPAPQSPDTTAPQVVLTTPVDGVRMGASQLVIATASDNNGRIARVDFFVDGQFKARVNTVPYSFNLASGVIAPGSHQITARAFDFSNNMAEYTVTVDR